MTGWFNAQSRFTRLTFQRESLASFPLAILMGVLDANFCGLVARKGFMMPDFLIALLMCAHMSGLLLTGPLIGFFQRTRKITALARIIYISSLILITISFLPQNARFQWLSSLLFIFQIFLIQVGLALAITLRSSLWRSNYPIENRGKIVILIYFIITLTKCFTILGVTSAIENLHLPFQTVYIFCGGFGLVSGFLFSRLRIRREKTLLRSVEVPQKGSQLLEGLSVLLHDRPFRQFMGWQMLNGTSTLIIDASGVLVLIITELFNANWLIGGLALSVVSMASSAFFGLLWAKVFDRNDIFIMRFYGAMGWALSRAVLIVGILTHSIEIVLLSRVITGISMGLGQLTWRLGHMHFSTPEKDHLYMAAHISLTGIRGMIVPFLGIFFYSLNIFGSYGIGLIALAGLGQAVAGFGFLNMRKKNLPEKPKHNKTASD